MYSEKSVLDTAEELEVGKDLSGADGRKFKTEPSVNIISKDEFEERVDKVFHLLWKSLAKSFGPYGAPTLIYNYPYSHVTKDGYTIMKNLSMNASETLVDQAIANMADDICGRLNYAVGDGTTTAIIATDSIYRNYRKRKDELEGNFILPRDVIKKYEEIKEEIAAQLREKVRVIQSSDPEVLRKNIYDVVYISSNGDEKVSGYIADLYMELGCPAISCNLSTSGETTSSLIDGYRFNLMLNDELYLNTEERTMDLKMADVIILSAKITRDVYETLLKPLNEECRIRGRHLIVAAPAWDGAAIEQVVKKDLNNEYRINKDINMVLCTYRMFNENLIRLAGDFATLCNTTIIDRTLLRDMMESLTTGKETVLSLFNIDDRRIDGTQCVCYGPGEDGKGAAYRYTYPEIIQEEGLQYPVRTNDMLDLGFVKDISLGMKTSVFGSFVYDDEKYEKIKANAKQVMEETEEKYKKMGTFNVEVSQAQERYYSLNLKMGMIEVGADSELSRALLKDAVDDAIRAAASAFNNGVISGCNVSTIQVIRTMLQKEEDSTRRILLDILFNGFKDVYKTVLSNASTCVPVEIHSKDEIEVCMKETFRSKADSFSSIASLAAYEAAKEDGIENPTTHDIVVYTSILYNEVYDISKWEFSDKVINSTQTDMEVMKATIDLISLLITGNQMVVTMKHNFQD